MNKLARSSIELLPDELWLEVFTYTPLLDLHYAWRNLNSHIDAIIQSVSINVHINSKSNQNIDFKNVLTHYPLQAVSIKDERWDTKASSQSEPICLLPLLNLRSLYLGQCLGEQFNQLATLRQLNRLSLPCDSSSQTFLEKFVLDKEGKEHFPQLYSIGRIWCGYEKSRDFSSATINTTIRHIHLVVPSCSSTINFIQQLPELSSISVDYLGNEADFTSSCFILAKICHQYDDRLKKISSKMNSSSQSIDQKNLTLMTFAPRVYRLQIDFNGQCDFVKLARILQRCMILERIQIKVKYYPKDLDLSSIRQLSPFFIALNFGDVNKETGKPVIVAKWPS
jgi:hypothetical protein